MEYFIVAATGNIGLASVVNEALKDGWELYGNPFSNEKYVYQALIKREDTPQ